jgi:hypothetical protein
MTYGSLAPLAVVVFGDGRHLFDATRDPRVRIVTGADAPPDLVVFPCSRFRRFENIDPATLPESLRTRIVAGQVGLIFDSSLEGVAHKPDITAALHAVIGQLGAAPQRCVYVTQDRQYETDYRAHCLTAQMRPASVLVHDYWIWDALSQYESTGDEIFSRRLAAFHARQPHRQRIFVSLNRTPRPTKILFLLRLLRDGLWAKGFISFGGFRQKVKGPGKDRPSAEQLAQSLPGFEDLAVQLAPFIDRLDAYGRVLLGIEQHGWTNIDLTNAGGAVELDEYDESWFTLVTETEMRARPSRITEKVLKPLVNFHPLLVLGNPGALEIIREYGFATFEDLFDESYDAELDPRRRFDRVYEQFRRACERPEQEWVRLEQCVQERLIENARWGLTRFPSTFRRQQDPIVVNRVLKAIRSAD